MAPNFRRFPTAPLGQAVSWTPQLLGGLLGTVMATVMAPELDRSQPQDRSWSGSRVGAAAMAQTAIDSAAPDRSTESPPVELQIQRRSTSPRVDAVAPVFVPHVPAILQSLPLNTQLRLPSQLLIDPDLAPNPDQLYVQVLAARTPPIATVNLMTCERGIVPCLVGSISVEPKYADNAQRELARHRAQGKPITLGPNLTAHLWDGLEQRPVYGFSSVMWEQDQTIYTVTFPAQARQSLLYMALQMAQAPPVTPPRVGGR